VTSGLRVLEDNRREPLGSRRYVAADLGISAHVGGSGARGMALVDVYEVP
jgi:hypothetical protein